MRTTWRALTIDTHFPDAPFITFDNFDAEREVAQLVEAGVDSAHVWMKCHWGHFYYDTKVGTRHPRLDFDLAAAMVPALKDAGIEVIAYTGFWFETRTAREHPDWTVRDPEGNPVIWRRLHGDADNWRSRRWGMCCPNHPEYRAYCLVHIEEVFEGYDFDGIFLDIVGEGFNWRFACHCEHCRRRYAERGIDPMTDRLAVVNAWCDWWAELLIESKQRMLKHNPKGILSLNGGPFRLSWRALKHLDWPYTEGGENGFNPIVLRGCGLPHPQSGIGAGPAAYDDWSAERVQLQTSTVLAHGNRTFFFYMTGRDPDGSFAQHKLDFLKRINDETREKQAWVEGTDPIRAVAVYHSEATLLDAASRDDEGMAGKRTTTLIDHFRRDSIPCDFLPDWRCTDEVLREYKLVVVSNQTCLGEAEIEAFGRFVEAGGTLLAAGECGTRNHHGKAREQCPIFDLLGLRYEGISTQYETNGVRGYVPWVDHPYFRHLRNVEYNLWNNWPMVTAEEAEQITPVIKPVAVENDDNYVGWFPLPPGTPTSYAGLTERRLGRGRAIYSVSPIVWFDPNPNAKYDVEPKWPTVVMRSIVEHLGLDGGARIDGPRSAEATFHRKGDRLIVHLLNQCAGLPETAGTRIHDMVVCIDKDLFDVREARTVYPSKEPLEIRAVEHGCRIPAPPVALHTILELR